MEWLNACCIRVWPYEVFYQHIMWTFNHQFTNAQCASLLQWYTMYAFHCICIPLYLTLVLSRRVFGQHFQGWESTAYNSIPELDDKADSPEALMAEIQACHYEEEAEQELDNHGRESSGAQ